MAHTLTAEVRRALREAADPRRAAPMQAYMKSSMPYLGVSAKPLREITRKLFKSYPVNSFDEYKTIVCELWDSTFREERYAAIGFAEHQKKFRVPMALPVYRTMVETGAWWDLVDGVASHLVGGLLRQYPEEIKPEIRLWIDNPDLWIRRAAILSQLTFKMNTDAEMLFDFCLKQCHEREFWIRKAIGWALREYSKSNRTAVKQFIDAHRGLLSGLSLREGSKYI